MKGAEIRRNYAAPEIASPRLPTTGRSGDLRAMGLRPMPMSAALHASAV
jgi:hypothetical protein